MTKCHFCKKTIHGDYRIIGKGKTERYFHVLCWEKLRKSQAKKNRLEREAKKQKTLGVWTITQ